MTISIENKLAEIAEQGYTVLPDVLSSAQVEQILDSVRKISAQVPYAKPDSGESDRAKGSAAHRLRNLISRGAEFRELAMLAPVSTIVETLLKPGYLLFSSAINDVGPNERHQRLHTDDMLVTYPRPLAEPVTVNSVWALSDFTAENGATRVVPESHLSAHRPSEKEAIPVEMTRGSVLIYHGSLWHQAGANITSDDRRIAMILAYCARYIRPYENQMKLIPLEEARNMTAAERQLIGFDYVIEHDLRRG